MLLIADATRLFLDAMDDIKPEDIPGNFVIETFEKCQFLFESRTIPQDSGIGSREAGPVRARGMDAPSQRENFNRRNTLSISRIELKLHFVQNVEPDTEIGQKGTFCKGLVIIDRGKTRIRKEKLED